ncbi:MAG: hypothetical protein O9319_07395 [Gemmatimonas sp.]|uniref:hypothetical protein n=1 Tax=Gemmatimonas sp. TaxID=1962908 RepID=UPI0022C93D5B|nr:hypothetical protein [Gemmatimonas sp.]MCZ8012398.1 hypothetical protein [Gemmatimonas sp.]MCZ8266673.1 hypothetical protein [Gemmatimonas sp.]
MRLPSPAERRVLLLQRAALIVFGPRGSVRYLHTHDPTLGTTPAAAAWAGGEPARRAGEALREIAIRGESTTGERPG